MAHTRKEARAWSLSVRHAPRLAILAALALAGQVDGQERRPMSTMQMLVLDGAAIGVLGRVEGGGTFAEVVQSPSPNPVSTKKHITSPRYEDITLELGPAMGKGLYDWITASWAGSVTPKSGSIVTVGYDMKARAEREFVNAVITATTFPALDAASRDAFALEITLTPALIRLKHGSGTDVKAPFGPKTAAKQLLVSNFRFDMDGLATDRVSRIESFTVRQPVATEAIGDRREYPAGLAGRIAFPNLTVTFTDHDAQSWVDWHEDFVVNGNNGDDKEKNGAIVLLSADRKTEMLRLGLQQCGIFRLAPERSESRAAATRLTAELYCERMQLNTGVGVALTSF